MKNRLLGLAVVIVALAGIINALALKSADITNKVAITVAGNATSLIGITTAGAGTQDPDVSISDTNNQAVLTLAKGLQAGSKYEFDAAFAIVNRSASDSVNITLPTVPKANGVAVTFDVSTRAGAKPLTGLAAGDTVWVKMTVELDEGAGTTSLPSTDFVIKVNRP